MKKLFVILGMICVAAELFADYPDAVKNDPRNTPEAKAARKERRMRTTGGLIDDYREYKGRFLYLNAQKLVAPEEVQDLTIGTMRDFFRAKFELVMVDGFELGRATEIMKTSEAQAAVFLIDDPLLPTLLSAPEDKWTLVNVAKLASDKPDQKTLARRVRREMWRALAYTLGCASPDELCVMKPVHSLKDLDDLSANALSRFPLMNIKEQLPKVGIGSIRSTTYKRACEEGWAPSPTNDYQRGVWNQVYETPSNPIKIQFDPKTDTK